MEAGPKERSRVLVMVDDYGLSRRLKRTLLRQGCAVELAHTGVGALDHCMRKDFELLVVELRLPDRDGMEIIRLAKEQRPDIQVLVIAGCASIEAVVECFQYGACDYLSKPFTESEFKAAVAGVLSHKEGALPVRESTGREARLVQRREVVRVLQMRPLDFVFWCEFMIEHSSLMKLLRLSRGVGMGRGTL